MKPEERQKFLLVLVIIAAGLWLGEKFIFTPTVNLWKSRSESIVKLRAQVKDGKMLESRQENVRGQWDNMRTNTLPNDRSQAEALILKSLDDWRASSGVAINSFTPQWKDGDTTDYMTLNCNVEASGDIRTLSRLLYLIERDPMGLKFDSASLSARDNLGQVMQLSLQISGLSLLPSKKP